MAAHICVFIWFDRGVLVHYVPGSENTMPTVYCPEAPVQPAEVVQMTLDPR